MARVADLSFDEMSAEQRQLFNEIAGPRGGTVRGPFAIWLRNPQVASCANQLGNALRLDGKLDKKLFELVILVVARHWTAQYEWFVHAKAGAEVGLNSAIIEAIRVGQQPAFEADDQQLVYDFVTELVTTKTIGSAMYERVLKCFGIDLVIEIVTVVGFYTLAAMMLNAFDAPVPGDARPLD
jgi:4-carboxymuconolactone decarboxylase